ncbi:potassium uptake TrkH family protein [Nesterenkonia aurantiaca]|uniref:Potassium uptake TrkH family protein n=1 Tax=Nesterenkonia aurantiaca TaxID=1436010 RepID=A0A4R7G4L3_9MICC|nr:TrkH family potassium uptake protein [Nesterenkonia aurantiaca]TDS86317.1 potassium uptake TrkH family protein [Nesterenkonia aurantiaca]
MLRRVRPVQLIFLGFLLTAAVGTGLLLLPAATAPGEQTDFIHALFTATSALCVTGLVVVDTATHWSPLGQAVILVLIQLGGFGVMTFATVIGLIVLGRLSLRSKLVAATEAKSLGLADLRSLILGIVKISLSIEGVLAVVLVLRFYLSYQMGFGEALWQGVFHSVSAFNNAGFSLFSDSMMGFVADPVVCLSMAAAIILGGLGFPVIIQLRRHFRTPRLWSMHTRIVVWATTLLLVLGTALITVLEWSNPRTLGPLHWSEKLLAGFFQSVQTRTAGFNSVDISAMEPTTWLGIDVLMLIGGAPAGTAGGIKVTTFAVLLFILITELRGDAAVNIFGKRLSRSVHRQAIAVVLLALALITVVTGVLMHISGLPLDQVLFETVSAFSTVGLSTGITADLPVLGRLLLVMLMFIGRIGPITFASALALRERRTKYELPKERPIIG